LNPKIPIINSRFYILCFHSIDCFIFSNISQIDVFVFFEYRIVFFDIGVTEVFEQFFKLCVDLHGTAHLLVGFVLQQFLVGAEHFD